MLRASRSLLAATLVALCTVAAVAVPARGGMIFDASGTSAAGHPVAFRATLTISGPILALVLENRSPVSTLAADDVLTSFYFDVVSGTSRPNLALTSGSGSVWQVRSGTSDVEYRYLPQSFTRVSGSQSDLVARNPGDASWQFLTMDAGAPPFLGFGIGTVGNSGLAPNGFAPAVVGPSGNGMINFGIFKGGDIDPVGVLDQKYLVKNTATFTFSGAAGFTEANIVGDAAFGLGTGPDAVISLPEPAGLVGAISGCLVGAVLRRRIGRTVASRASAVRHTGTAASASTIAAMKAGRSAGLRLEMK